MEKWTPSNEFVSKKLELQKASGEVIAGRPKIVGRYIMSWRSFLIGLTVGVVLTLGAVFAAGSRYKVAQSAGGLTIKLDTWTGKSWMVRFFGEKEFYWVEIKNQ